MPRKRTPHEVDTAEIENNAKSPEMVSFAKTLNSLLVEKGIHQEDMARALDISTGSISSYRNGKKEPRLLMIIKIADYLGVDCHYLMTGVQAKNRMSSKELGLSEKAINAIKKSRGWGMDVLNCFLEDSKFFNLLLEVRRLATAKYRLKVAETDLTEMSDAGYKESVMRFTEKRIVQEYWTVEKFKELQNRTVDTLISQKEFQKFAGMAIRAKVREFDQGEAENHGKH